MSLEGKFWITPEADIDISGHEHFDYAIAFMLLMDRQYAPRHWNSRGVPKEELAAAIARGASSDAVDFLDQKKDSRLWVMRELGWIRTAKAAWNLWEFDDETADMARNAKDYWKSQYYLTDSDMIDVSEFKTGDHFRINAKRFRAGGDPRILKDLAMGRLVEEVKEEITPQYSTAKFGELERQKLYGRTGANPRRRKS